MRTTFRITLPAHINVEKLRKSLELDVVLHWLLEQGRSQDASQWLNEGDEALRIEAVNAGMSFEVIDTTQDVMAKIPVDRDELVDFMNLFKMAAGLLALSGDESASVECEQTAEMIEGFYLPYDSNGVYIDPPKEH